MIRLIPHNLMTRWIDLEREKKNKNNDDNIAKQLIKTQVFGWSLKHLTAYMKLTVTESKRGLFYSLILLR